MAVDMTDAQKTWIADFRSKIAQTIRTLIDLDYLRLRTAGIGTPDQFVSGAFSGANADVSAADLDAALATLGTIRNQFYDPTTGLPTAALTTLLKVAPSSLP